MAVEAAGRTVREELLGGFGVGEGAGEPLLSCKGLVLSCKGLGFRVQGLGFRV